VTLNPLRNGKILKKGHIIYTGKRESQIPASKSRRPPAKEKDCIPGQRFGRRFGHHFRLAGRPHPFAVGLFRGGSALLRVAE
jgi:hypothetical protein